jgi:16S rRNA processing protein RimM
MALVGRVVRTHGLRGDVVVSPETDFVETRFAVGATVFTRSDRGDEELTIDAVRLQGGRPIVAFHGFTRIEDAERLVGLELRIPDEALHPLAPGTYYEHQLRGCLVERADGLVLGPVRRVEGGAGSVQLVVEGEGGEILIPLTTSICTDIDVDARRIRIEPPEGLLELNEDRHRHDLPQDGGGRARGGRRRPGR